MTIVIPPGFFEFMLELARQGQADATGNNDPNRGRSSATGRSRKLRSQIKAIKPKRKVSAYQKEFGRQLKKLKKAHPRTPITKLMKRAHRATKRAMK